MSDTLSEIKHSVAKKGKKMYEKKKDGSNESFSSSETSNADSLADSSSGPGLGGLNEGQISTESKDSPLKVQVDSPDYVKI